MAGVRFEDVDLLGALSRIVDLHTQHYKEDFDLDKELISKLAVSDRSEDKQLLWMSRPCGTYTLREREVYLDGSHENKVWRFYQEQTNDPVLAYAISLKEVRDGKIFGDLYPLNYREHVERMKKLTCPIGNVAVAFEDGNGVWSTSTVLRILEDQRYIGTYVIGKRKVKEIGSRHTQLKDESEWFKIPNHHPAIVSVDLFERANASIKRFSLSNKKPRDYLLRGKVFCGCCDHAMSLRNGAWFYCRHSEVAETLPCHGVRIKMADLEQVVFETIRAQMCPALGIDSNKDKLDLQTVQQTEHEEKLRSIQDSKRYLYEQYALGEIDLETYRTRKAVYDTELVQAKNVHAVITAQTKQIKSDYEIKLKQQEIVQKVGNANMLTKALIDRLINKVYVFPGDRIEIEYATQDFLETKESEKEV